MIDSNPTEGAIKSYHWPRSNDGGTEEGKKVQKYKYFQVGYVARIEIKSDLNCRSTVA